VTEDEVRKLLARKIEQAGSLRAFCREHDLDPTYVGRVRDGAKLSPAILNALELEGIVSYRKRGVAT
jgi:hypothetical protein